MNKNFANNLYHTVGKSMILSRNNGWTRIAILWSLSTFPRRIRTLLGKSRRSHTVSMDFEDPWNMQNLLQTNQSAIGQRNRWSEVIWLRSWSRSLFGEKRYDHGSYFWEGKKIGSGSFFQKISDLDQIISDHFFR